MEYIHLKRGMSIKYDILTMSGPDITYTINNRETFREMNGVEGFN